MLSSSFSTRSKPNRPAIVDITLLTKFRGIPIRVEKNVAANACKASMMDPVSMNTSTASCKPLYSA